MSPGGVRVESGRLTLRALDDGEMESLVAGEDDAELKQAYAEMLAGCRREPDKRVWHAVWVMELKGGTGEAVGDLSFKGLGADGMVELGYGLREGCCGKGYMTEAVRAMAAWAASQPGVTRVEAETEAGNGASRRVLEHAGFVPTGERGAEGPRFVWRGKSGRR